MSDPRAEVVLRRLSEVNPAAWVADTPAGLTYHVITDADAADKTAGIYRVSLDAAVEAAAQKDCEDWGNCTVRDAHRAWAREALTAAIVGGAQ